MKIYNAILIDDERNVREALGLLLKEHCPEIHICGTAASASEGRELLKIEDIDFIFVTAYEEYALRALKACAIDYLLKPVSSIELREAVTKAIQSHELRKAKADIKSIYHQSLDNLHDHINSGSNHIEKITIAEQFGFRMVKVSDLMYLQADSNYTILHLSGLDKIVATRSLGEFDKILEGSMFFRIHKSTVINMNFLKAYSSYEGNFAELTDGTKLSISRRKLIDFRDAVKHFSKSIE